jgi:hypothetical protein
MEKIDEDIRWKQRFYNYKKALATLKSAVELAATRDLTDLEKQGLIQGFEFTYDEKTANDLAEAIIKNYYLQFTVFSEKMNTME